MKERDQKRSRIAQWRSPRPEIEIVHAKKRLNEQLNAIHEPDIKDMIARYQKSMASEGRYYSETERSFDRRVRNSIASGCERFCGIEDRAYFSRWVGATTAWNLYVPSLHNTPASTRLQLAARRAILISSEVSQQIDEMAINPDIVRSFWREMTIPHDRKSVSSLIVKDLLTDFVNNPHSSEEFHEITEIKEDEVILL